MRSLGQVGAAVFSLGRDRGGQGAGVRAAATSGPPLSRWSAAEIDNEAVVREIVLIEIHISILTRKALTPCHFNHLDELAERILGSQAEFGKTATSFAWTFTE